MQVDVLLALFAAGVDAQFWRVLADSNGHGGISSFPPFSLMMYTCVEAHL
ncbi:MAG: hypothetical protein IIY87_00920 [Bacteroidales bacterium]|nr:hypothetical protein [Bacteroidales bacterium]